VVGRYDCIGVDKAFNQNHINIGTRIDLTIKELAEVVKELVGFNGELDWDTTKPDGTPKKQLDVSLLNKLDWKAQIALKDGINMVYRTYVGQ
jgi:GDP-L-fucose synthase